MGKLWGDEVGTTHGLLPMTGQHGGRYDPQPVTRSSELSE